MSVPRERPRRPAADPQRVRGRGGRGGPPRARWRAGEAWPGGPEASCAPGDRPVAVAHVERAEDPELHPAARPAGRQRPQRREVRRQIGGGELEEMLGAIEVLQPMLTEI